MSPFTSTKLYEVLPRGSFFRLLKLLPGKEDEPITCELSVHDIMMAPPYEALSYVWGDPTITSEVLCNGQRFNVTINLKGALQRLRLVDQARTLWADAICIDQSNVGERGHQVNLMGLVYESALKVLIWLGEDSQCEAQAAFHLIQELNLYYAPKTRSSDELDKIRLPPEKTLLFMNASKWLPVFSLFRRDWFTRVWVLQEVGLAKTAEIFWGCASLKFSQLIEFICILYSSRAFQSADYQFPVRGPLTDTFYMFWCTTNTKESWKTECPLIRVLSHRPINASRCDFLNVISISRFYKASDRRDNIYAFLGHPSAKIATSPDAKIVDADYEKDLQELYWDLAVKLMDSRCGLSWLSEIVHHSEGTLSKAPVSWTSLWDSTEGVLNIAPFPGALGPRADFCAGISQTSEFEMIIEPIPHYENRKLTYGRLRLRGVVFDCVHNVSNIMQPAGVMQMKPVIGANTPTAECSAGKSRVRNPIEEAWSIISTDPSLARANSSPKSKRNSLYELSVTLTIGIRGGGSGILCEDDVEAHLADFQAYCYGQCSEDFTTVIQREFSAAPSSSTMPTATNGNAEIYSSSMMRHCNNRRFFTTRNRQFYGIGPQLTREGDICCVLVGAKVPFILRPAPKSHPSMKNSTTTNYQLIGECYIHDVMHGEMLEKALSGEEHLQDIILV